MAIMEKLKFFETSSLSNVIPEADSGYHEGLASSMIRAPT
jgi:hypothetical protein